MTLQLIFIILFVTFIGISIYLHINQARIRGKWGEKRISSKLLSLSNEYHLFDNVYIEAEGRSVQIDHVIISRYGVFVIETKNYTGWIFGTDQAEYWTKNVYGTKFQFRNPLKQNYSHMKSLQTLLNIPVNKFIPIVVFLNGATLKCHTSGNVIYSHQLKKTILSYQTTLLSELEVEMLINKLHSVNVMDKEREKNHINKVRKEINEKHILVASGICPRCKGKLVERQGKHGRFLGCNNYPKCKFTTNLFS